MWVRDGVKVKVRIGVWMWKRKARLVVLLGPEVGTPSLVLAVLAVLAVLKCPVRVWPRSLPRRTLGLMHQKIQLIYCRHGGEF